MSLLMYRYRLYPSRNQKERLVNAFKTCKAIYNELLALNIDAYKFGGVSLGRFDFNYYLSGRKDRVFSQCRLNVSDRVGKAFQNFFRRVKNLKCRKKGFPRFKSRVNSITYPRIGFKFISNKKLYCPRIGNIPIILNRVPKGKIKTLTIKQNKSNQWFAVFSCEMPEIQVKHPSSEKVGIDVGLESFATLSTGEVISNPRFLIKAEKKLKLLQRRLSRKVKGSANRRKARFKLAKQHLKVENQRSDFLHKLSHRLTKSYSFIAVENLNVKSMLNNHWMAKSISDASWNDFVNMLSYKAVTCGGQLVKVNPRNTSKTCSECGTIAEMPLNKREFLCPSCGFLAHRDLNASINILKVATDGGKLNAYGDSTSTTEQSVVSGINETGTIHGSTSS